MRKKKSSFDDMGNNPMVGATVAVYEAIKQQKKHITIRFLYLKLMNFLQILT